MSYIFISYSHKDKEYAHRLEKALKRRDFEVWLDDRIDYGTQWPKKIQEKLDGCKALILVMTARSYDSDWVQSELSRAKRKRKNIFPLLLEGEEPWLSVEATQYVDVRGGKLPQTAFYDTLAKVVPRKNIGASEQIEVKLKSEAATPTKLVKNQPASFRNPFELDAEYILIPGGRYKYHGKTETEVPNIYFAKYPVTNKRYRRFISYLEGKEDDLSEILALKMFRERMFEFAATINGFPKYLGTTSVAWADRLRSNYDDEKRFRSDDQSAVGVSWFTAQTYCRWLSLLDAASKGTPFDESGNKYRLPTELEWEWAALGGKRKYPWGDKEPNDKLANYNKNIGATTAVGQYPEGATPEGLMDMAGNVWEWMENRYEGYESKARSLRGGSWYRAEYEMHCSWGIGNNPNSLDAFSGFRVVHSQS